jgi:membrane fusion protein (multidrug efflux system)
MRGFVIGLMALSVLAGCDSDTSSATAPPVQVSVLQVVPKDTPVSFEYVGQTESASQVQIVARVSGFLDQKVYTEGSMVKAGDVLFQQDPKPFRAELNAAKGALAAQQARLEVASDNLARVQPLVALNALAQKDLDDAIGAKQTAEAAVEIAKADVEQAQLNLGYTTIRTPVAGASSYARVNVGSYLDAQNSLLTYVSPLDPMYVNFSLSENEMLQFRMEQQSGRLKPPPADEYKVDIILADGTTFGQQGRITFADADFDQDTGTYRLRATFPNPDGSLRQGQFVRVRVIGAVRPQAILVPQKAVLQGAQGHFVIVVDKDNKAQIRPVQVGSWNGPDWFITSGLSAGDTVVVEGVAQLSPGMPVTVAPSGGGGAAGAAAAPSAPQ